MCRITYYGGLSDSPVNEYLTINHDGYAGQKAMQKLLMIAERAKAFIHGLQDIDAYFIYGDNQGVYNIWHTEGLRKYIESP